VLKTNIRSALQACAVLLGVSLSGIAYAADVSTLVEPCSSCHGKDGVSTEAEVPTIAGYSEEYFSYSLEMYQKKERPCIEAEYHTGSKKGSKISMCEIVKDMSESDIELMAVYFSGQKFVRTQQTYDAELAKMGEEIHMNKCDECHSKAGSSPDDNAGYLGGQKMDYLREQLKFVRDGKRFTSKKMKKRLEAFDDAGIEAVVHYYGSIQK
jgi:sulfide dehydrogenase cytochrome subunit